MKPNVSSSGVGSAEPTTFKPKSWADIVKPGKTAQVQEEKTNLVVPGERGSRRVLCTGELLVMLGHYGWIMSLMGIDHPDSKKHAGRIYLKGTDIRPGCQLTPGTVVAFYLYADVDGLGAEDCHALEAVEAEFPELSMLEGAEAKKTRTPPKTNAVLAEPVASEESTNIPNNKWQSRPYPPPKWHRNTRQVGVPAPVNSVPVEAVTQWLEGSRTGMRFSPPPWSLSHRPPEEEAYPPSSDIFKMNFGGLLDSDSDDSDSEEDAPKGPWSNLAARCSQAVGGAGSAPPVPTSSPKSLKNPSASYASEVSTSAGETSDSDTGLEAPPGLQPTPFKVVSKRGARGATAVRPPPGLELMAGPPGLCPPPGLELPSPPGIA